MRKKLKLLILMGGPSAEHEVSVASGKNVLAQLDRKKYAVTACLVPQIGEWNRAILRAIKKYQPDIVFTALHGTFGEDGRVQGLLECAGVPYTGSGICASALAMDKVLSGRLFEMCGLAVPAFDVFKKHARVDTKNIKLPVVIKPADSGSSVGVTIVKNRDQITPALAHAWKSSERAIVQRFIDGREVTCGVLENPKTHTAFALPPTEIIPRSHAFFDYRAKYTAGGSNEITPARFPKVLLKKIQDTALAAHTALGCRGMSRTDMIIRGKDIFVLETNTIPGMTHTSLLPQGAQAAGISFPKLLDTVILCATTGQSE